MQERTFEAKKENLTDVLSFTEAFLEQMDCPPKAVMAVDLALEEVYVNVCFYAYPDVEGVSPEKKDATATVVLKAGADNRSVQITLKDHGVPYNPLGKNDPDITLSAEQRDIGGLGIFLVKKYMDDVSYEYRGGENCLTLTKNW